MKILKFLFVALIVLGSVIGAYFYGRHSVLPSDEEVLRQANLNILKEFMLKFNARGGAYILIDRDTGETVDTSFINMDENFALTPHNINKLFLYAAGLKNGEITAENVSFEKDKEAYKTITDEAKKPVYEALNLTDTLTPRQLLTAYTSLLNNQNNLLTTEQLDILRAALLNNVQNGISRKAQVEGVQVSGISSTDHKENAQRTNVFLADFALNGKNYAIITVLDEPKPLKITYGFNSAGWNAVPMTQFLIRNMIK